MKYNCAYTELIDVHKLQPNPKNPNKHPDRQVELLAKIIDYQGQRSPVVVSKRSGFIVKGHGRLAAIKKLGWDKAAVDYQDYESEAQEFADMIADNKIAELAEHDDNIMIEGIKEIQIDDFELLGLDDFELPVEPDAAKNDIEDEIPSEVDTRCKPGDLWLLGDHRLLCGDSTNIQHVERLMNGEKADMVFTDPPYNLGFKYNSHNDSMSTEQYEDFCRTWFNNLKVVTKKIIITPGTKNLPMWMVIDCDVTGIACWIKKNWITSCKISNLQQWEPILFYGPFERDRSTDIYEINRRHQKDVGSNHTCPKQIELLEEIFNSYGRKTILDVFGGSGTTLIACEKTNRKCYMMEIDPYYCDVILSRWEKYSGKEAKIET